MMVQCSCVRVFVTRPDPWALQSVRFGQLLRYRRYAHECKERKNMQVQLIPFRKK